jgi:DDE_Tnp_1-associated
MGKGYAAAEDAFDRVIDFLRHFDGLEDPRQRAKVLYPLDEILLLCLPGVLAGCESWVEIARFGEKKLALLRRFRPFKDGTPSHDQLGGIFAAVDAQAFQSCFIAWVSSLTKLSRRRMPHPQKERARQLHHHQAHGEQPPQTGPRKGQLARQTESCRLGRRLPCKPRKRLKSFTGFPWHRPAPLRDRS